MNKTPEDIAREVAAKLVWNKGHRYIMGPPDYGHLLTSVREQGEWWRAWLAQQIAEAIRAYAAQSPVHGSPLSDERLAHAKWFISNGPPDTAAGEVIRSLLAHIDYLHAIMADDIDTRARDEAYRKGKAEGRHEGALAQREADANWIEGSFIGVANALRRQPLVTEDRP